MMPGYSHLSCISQNLHPWQQSGSLILLLDIYLYLEFKYFNYYNLDEKSGAVASKQPKKLWQKYIIKNFYLSNLQRIELYSSFERIMAIWVVLFIGLAYSASSLQPASHVQSPVQEQAAWTLGSSKAIEKTCDASDEDIIFVMSKYNPLCANWQGEKCVRCASQAYFDKNGKCVQVNPLCKSFDQANGDCTSCYPGYILKAGKCFASSQSQGNQNPLCAKWANGKCLKCSQQSYMSSSGICLSVSPQCKTYSQVDGKCTSCYAGFNLIQQQGRCVKEDIKDQWPSSVVKNPLCSKWGSQGQCILCSNRSYLNKEGVCTQVSPMCREYSSENGMCLSCYPGYKLDSGKCLEEKQAGDQNPLCSKWENGKCARCSSRSYLSQNGVCLLVDPQCQSYSEATGECLSCYPGYVLGQGKCVINKQNQAYSDPLCSRWSAEGLKCLTCSSGAIFNSQGRCITVDPQCKTYSQQNGECLSCYPGFALEQGKCRTAKTRITVNYASLNPLCAQWVNERCTKCSPRSFMSAGVCQSVDPKCQTFDDVNGNCLSCYVGSTLILGKCVTQAQVYQTKSNGYDDPLCAQWDSPTNCTKCSFGAYFGLSGKCTTALADPNCQKFDPDASKCVQCSVGSQLIEGKCFNYSSTFKIQVKFSPERCSHWKDGGCLKCPKGFDLSQNGICQCLQKYQ